MTAEEILDLLQDGSDMYLLETGKRPTHVRMHPKILKLLQDYDRKHCSFAELEGKPKVSVAGMEIIVDARIRDPRFEVHV